MAAAEPRGERLTGEDNQIWRFGVCLLMTNVPLECPRKTVRTPSCGGATLAATAWRQDGGGGRSGRSLGDAPHWRCPIAAGPVPPQTPEG